MTTLQDIKYYSNNNKKHSEEQLELIAKSVSLFGWRQHILVNQDGVIITGHGRFEAFQKYQKRLNLPDPYIVDDKGNVISGKLADWELSIEEEKAYRILDNTISEMSKTDENVIKVEMLEIPRLDLLDIMPIKIDDINIGINRDFDTGKEINLYDLENQNANINFVFSQYDYLDILEKIQSCLVKSNLKSKEELLKKLLNEYV